MIDAGDGGRHRRRSRTARSPCSGWAEATAGDRSRLPGAARSPTTWPTSSTPRGRPAGPRGWRCATPTASMIGEVEPNWNGDGWLHASPLFTFAGIALVYTPMKLGLRGDLPAALRRRPLAARWWRRSGRWPSSWSRPWPTCSSTIPASTRSTCRRSSMCSVGSAPLAPYVVERLQEKMPDALVSNNYGMTEAGSAYCIMPKGEAVKRPGSVGQIAPPAVVRIVDEHDQQLPPDVVGEVRLQMPGRQREYFERSRGHGRDVEGRLAGHGRPRQARRGRLPLHRRPLART